ncbi:3270_t:CDS:1, partial [Paraglomus occultum]
FRRSYQYPFLVWKPLKNAGLPILDSSSSSADERIERNKVELDEQSPPITNEEFEKGMSELEKYLQHMCEEFDTGDLRHPKDVNGCFKKA